MNNPIKIDPEICHGTPCFAGTRVFVETLYDYLAAGSALDEFLLDFPGVDREQAIAVLRIAQADIATRAIRSDS